MLGGLDGSEHVVELKYNFVVPFLINDETVCSKPPVQTAPSATHAAKSNRTVKVSPALAAPEVPAVPLLTLNVVNELVVVSVAAALRLYGPN
jgi:hypothetical protein